MEGVFQRKFSCSSNNMFFNIHSLNFKPLILSVCTAYIVLELDQGCH